MKEMDVKRQMMRMQDQKREINKLLREYASVEHIKNQFQSVVLELASTNH